MSGYSRQSVADIIANAVIKAAPVNAEFNAIRDAFAFAGGHKHDGSSTEGAYIPLIADVDANNKVVVDTSNNRISFYVEVGGAAVEQLRIQDGKIVPVTDDDIDLGAVGAEFKDLYIDGIGYIDTIQVHENATITGNLTVNGNTTIGNSATDTVTVNADVASNLIPDADSTRTLGDATNYWSHGYIDAVTTTGNATVGGNLAVTGTTSLTGTATITSADINSGAMDAVTIGSATPAAGTFTNLTATGTSTLSTVDINAGAIDGTTIGGSSPAAITGTTITSTGLGTFPSVNIDGGAIDGTTIGATSAAAGSFTTLTTSGAATLASADINGGTIDGAVIGGASAAAITGTTITGTSLVGPLTGAVTGNVTGNLTGNVTGNVTGNLTGNVTAASGTSTFTDVTINGTLNMNAATTATIQNLTEPTNLQDAATKNYVDTSIASLVDSAPGTLDTLNELAAALGDDPNFSTTITNSIATKLPLAGGTMTGAIAMSTNKITGLGDPTANQDAATKAYVDTQDAAQLSLTGGTMTGAIDMGANKITTTYTPTDAADLTTKTYVDDILGSATAAADSAAAAATSESNAATSETNAANSASAAATSEANAAASYDSFDDRYLGAKATAPTLDNDGDALIIGALYFNTTANLMYVYSASGWVPAGSSVNGTSDRVTYTATSGQTVFAATYDTGYVDVYLNGVKLVAGTDFTATNGTSITLATGATTGDVVDIVAYGTFVLADHYTEAQSDARFVNVTGDTMTGGLNVTGGSVGIGTSSPASELHLVYDDSTTYSTTLTDSGIRIENINSTLNTFSQLRLRAYNADSLIRSIYEGGNKASLVFLTDNEGATGDAGEVMRLTSDGNVLVNKTSAGVNTEPGFYISQAGNFGSTVDGGTSLYINRQTSDGDLIEFRRDGSTVGSINAGDGDLVIGKTDAGTECYMRFGYSSLRIVPSEADGTPNDATLDLGDASARWKDLYLSSTAYLGSTSSVLEGGGGDLFVRNTNTGADFYLQSGRSTLFYTTGSERMRIDSSGNVGIGTSSPAATSSTYKNLQMALGGVLTGRTDDTPLFLSSNLSYDSGWKYIANTTASQISLATNIQFFNAPSGTAGSGATLTERMRIDSSGNLLVGCTAAGEGVGNTNTGATVGSFFSMSRDGGTVGYFNRNTSDGDIVQFRRAGTQVGSIGVIANDLFIGTTDVSTTDECFLRFAYSGIGITPAGSDGSPNDNALDLGQSVARFNDIYATNGTIQTSDRNEKQDIEALSDAEQRVAVAAKGLLRKYRWKDAVAEKGDAARIHFGIIAQDLQAAFEAEGLDAARYGMFISSTWWEAERVIPAVEAKEAVLDSEGNVLEEAVEAQPERTVVDTYETQDEAPEGATERTRLGVRYPELLAFIIAAL